MGENKQANKNHLQAICNMEGGSKCILSKLLQIEKMDI